jgi:hypothetical protein
MTVVDGRAGIVAEVDRAPLGLRRFVITSVRQLLSDPKFSDALPGYSRRKRKNGLVCSVANLKALRAFLTRPHDERIESGTPPPDF